MTPADAEHPPLVTLAALYGAGGSVIGPGVAQKLGVAFLDREIPEAVARRTGLPEETVAGVEQEPRGVVSQFIESVARGSTMTGATWGNAERLDLQERSLRSHIEKFLAEASVSGGVALGRGGMVVLRSVPWALHVHLGGPPAARVEQGMRLEGIDHRTAESRQAVEDRNRIGYVQRAYGVHGEDSALYHLMLDSTALDLGTCVELIVAAARARARNPQATDPT